MNITMLEHTNLRTTRLDEMISWYEEVLGLEKGYRPPFGVEGAWLYKGTWPMVHLLSVDREAEHSDPQMEHFAFRAEGLGPFLTLLDSRKIPYRILRVPELRILQVYLSDPDGNHMHIDFQPEEADALGL